jgi:hypothetical protein
MLGGGDSSFFGITPSGTPGHDGAGSTNNGNNNLGISRVDGKPLNDFTEDEEEDLSDLIQLIAELNAH